MHNSKSFALADMYWFVLNGYESSIGPMLLPAEPTASQKSHTAITEAWIHVGGAELSGRERERKRKSDEEDLSNNHIR